MRRTKSFDRLQAYVDTFVLQSTQFAQDYLDDQSQSRPLSLKSLLLLIKHMLARIDIRCATPDPLLANSSSQLTPRAVETQTLSIMLVMPVNHRRSDLTLLVDALLSNEFGFSSCFVHLV